MMVVDTSVWASFFNGEERPEVARLERALDQRETVAVLPIIVAEVLQGFRTEAGFRAAQQVLRRLPLFDPPLEGYVDAARLYRRLRAKGITPRGAVDCIIAQACIDGDVPLLTLDRDFARMAEHSPLRLETAASD
jgi:hypothetical protein